MSKKLKILMSGGGTGGHIFPAVAIAQEIQKRFPDAEFLFIGANGKMEMEKVPQSGFKIEGLNIAGFDRGNLLKNIGLPFKIISSLMKAKKIIKDFKPDFAVGTGGLSNENSGKKMSFITTFLRPTIFRKGHFRKTCVKKCWRL